MVFEKDVGLDARHASFKDINRGHEPADLDHPFHYPKAPEEPERVKRHPAGLSLVLGGRGPIEWAEKLPAQFDSRHRWVPPPAAVAEPKPHQLPLIGGDERSQRLPKGSVHRLIVQEDRNGIRFGGKRTFPGIN